MSPGSGRTPLYHIDAGDGYEPRARARARARAHVCRRDEDRRCKPRAAAAGVATVRASSMS